MEATASVDVRLHDSWIVRLGRKIKSAWKRSVRAIAWVGRAAWYTVASNTVRAGRAVARGSRWVGRKAWLGLAFVGRGAARVVSEFFYGVQLLFTGFGTLILLAVTGLVLLALIFEPVRLFFRWLSDKDRGSLRETFRGAKSELAAEVGGERMVDLRKDDIVVELREAEAPVGADSTLTFLNDPETAVGPDQVDDVFDRQEAWQSAVKDPMNYDWDSEEPSSALLGIYAVIAQHADDPKTKGLFEGRRRAVQMFLGNEDDWETRIDRDRALMHTQLRNQQHIYPLKWLREGFAAQVETMQRQQVAAGV